LSGFSPERGSIAPLFYLTPAIRNGRIGKDNKSPASGMISFPVRAKNNPPFRQFRDYFWPPIIDRFWIPRCKKSLSINRTEEEMGFLKERLPFMPMGGFPTRIYAALFGRFFRRVGRSLITINPIRKNANLLPEMTSEAIGFKPGTKKNLVRSDATKFSTVILTIPEAGTLLRRIGQDDQKSSQENHQKGEPSDLDRESIHQRIIRESSTLTTEFPDRYHRTIHACCHN
jgi:hypothetical protein